MGQRVLRSPATNWREKAPNIVEVGETVWYRLDMINNLAVLWVADCPTEEWSLVLLLSLKTIIIKQIKTKQKIQRDKLFLYFRII